MKVCAKCKKEYTDLWHRCFLCNDVLGEEIFSPREGALPTDNDLPSGASDVPDEEAVAAVDDFLMQIDGLVDNVEPN